MTEIELIHPLKAEDRETWNPCNILFRSQTLIVVSWILGVRILELITPAVRRRPPESRRLIDSNNDIHALGYLRRWPCALSCHHQACRLCGASLGITSVYSGLIIRTFEGGISYRCYPKNGKGLNIPMEELVLLLLLLLMYSVQL